LTLPDKKKNKTLIKVAAKTPEQIVSHEREREEDPIIHHVKTIISQSKKIEIDSDFEHIKKLFIPNTQTFHKPSSSLDEDIEGLQKKLTKVLQIEFPNQKM
jgi:uncharacterized Zn finger protein (UPF0148 family)